MCTFYLFYSDIILMQYNKLEYCFECVPKHPQGWLPNVLSRRVDLLENALYAVPSVEGYAIRCVLCNTIIIPNVWASLNINMSHMYIDILQPAFIPPPPPPGLPLYIWWHGWLVLQLYCNIVRATSRHVYESAELRVIQRFETSQNTVRICLFSIWNKIWAFILHLYIMI